MGGWVALPTEVLLGARQPLPQGRLWLGTSALELCALTGGVMGYGVIKATMGLRPSQEEKFNGADLSIHRISATAERELSW